MEKDGVKTFLLGVGCQKGGTTWLFDYLSKSPHAAMPALKELHIFDALDLEIGKKRMEQTMRKNRKTHPGKRNHDKHRLKASMIENVENYFDYFAGLLDRPEALITADITPTYAALAPERYRAIKEGFEQRGIRVKVVFLMRDPVERVWSAVRMRLRDRAKHAPDSPIIARGEEALMMEVYDNRNNRERTEYHRTIRNLESVFDRDAILYGFYERLFNDDSTRQICDFLGIPHVAVDFQQRINESPKTAPISEQAGLIVAEAYRDVYRFVEDRFGAGLIGEIWPRSTLLPG